MKLNPYKTFIVFTLGLGVFVYNMNFYWGPLLYENLTTSAPRGIYYKTLDQKLDRGDYAIIALPVDLPAYERKKGYLLLKKAALLAGEKYEITADRLITLDSETRELREYSLVRSKHLPQLAPGSYKVPYKAYLFLNEPENSLDSRYLGPIGKNHVIAKVKLLLDYDCLAEQLKSLDATKGINITTDKNN